MTDTTVGDGEVSVGAVLNAGDNQQVLSQTFNAATGGQAYATIINNGGSQFLMYGSATDAVVNTGGQQLVNGTGTATGTILNGGYQLVDGSFDHYGADQTNPHYTYGTSVGTVINAGGVQRVDSYSRDTVINAGGLQMINNGGVAYSNASAVDGTTVNAGGSMFVYGGTATNTHLNAGGSILLSQSDYTAAATLSFNNATDVLTVADGQGVTDLALSGDYSNVTFTIDERGSYDTFSDLIHITAVPLCFCAGVRIATPDGERAVEELQVGDAVLTASGAARPIHWIGSQVVLVSAANRPVIVRKGAFSASSPTRDLNLTRGHSVLFGDVLIPVGHLVNGETVLWDEAARTVTLYHIALDRHDVLLADGAPAESYRDDGNRRGFASSAGTHPAPRSMPTCAPVVTHGPIVERTRRRLVERAGKMREHVRQAGAAA